MVNRIPIPKHLRALVPLFVPLCLCASVPYLCSTGCSSKKYTSEISEAILFTLPDVDSIQYKLEDYRGKIVLLHFWADWCPHCRKEFEKIQKAADELRDKGLQILAVNVGQSRQHVLELKEEYQLSIPLLMDENRDITEKYGVTGLPTSFFIDQNGVIKEKEIGWLTEQQIKSIFEKIQTEN